MGSPEIKHMTLKKWTDSNFKFMKFITNKPYILNQLHPALHLATTTPPSPNLQEWHVHARPKHPHHWLRWPVRHGSIRPTACSTTSSCCDLGPWAGWNAVPSTCLQSHGQVYINKGLVEVRKGEFREWHMQKILQPKGHPSFSWKDSLTKSKLASVFFQRHLHEVTDLYLEFEPSKPSLVDLVVSANHPKNPSGLQGDIMLLLAPATCSA